MKRFKWSYLLLGIFLILICSAEDASCTNANDVERRAVLNQQDIYGKSQPPPMFEWSLERDIMVQLYTIRSQARSTWSVLTAAGTGMPLYVVPSIGFPLPADVQLTNPLMLSGEYRDSSVVEQPEPNGLFSSKNTDATWVLEVGDDGKAYPIYCEQKVLCFPYPVRVENGAIVKVEGKEPTVEVTPHTSAPSSATTAKAP